MRVVPGVVTALAIDVHPIQTPRVSKMSNQAKEYLIFISKSTHAECNDDW